MNRRTRLRRTAILCLHCLRNAAYYRSWNAAPTVRRREQFWISLNGNFFDVCLLDWCKLFGDLKAKHHWSKTITDQPDFLHQMYGACGLNQQTFEDYRLEVRAYRDKYVAHLDEDASLSVPRLRHAIATAKFLYDYLVTVEDNVSALVDAPDTANARYREHLLEGRTVHQH